MSNFCECGCGTEIRPSRRVAQGHSKILFEKLKSIHKICACGCGQEVKVCKGKYVIADFMHGHNKGHFNHKHSDTSRKKMSEKSKELFAIPEFKEKFIVANKIACNTPQAIENKIKVQNSSEVKAKVLKGIKKFYENPINREQHSLKCIEAMNRPETKAKMKAIRSKPEVKERMRLKQIEIYNRPGEREKHRQAYRKVYPTLIINLRKAMKRPEVKEKQANTRSRLIAEGKIKPGKMFNTKPEIMFQNALIEKGYVIGETLINQFHCKKVGMVDSYLLEKNALIEIDGDYWHCNPNKYASDYFHKNIKMTAQQIWDRDKKKTGICIELGYKIIRFWESDIYKDINLCMLRLENEINN